MKLTLDWNCVIEVEEGRPQAEDVSFLIAAHRQGRCNVALLAASASENSKSKRFPGSARLFLKRIAALGWTDMPLVPMPAVIGLSYFDFSFMLDDGEAFERDMANLWRAIAPNIPRKPHEHVPDGIELDDDFFQSAPLWKWRNTWCDVVSAYSHIKAGRDVFVTNNISDFQKNSEHLAPLGMKKICTPVEARKIVSEIIDN